MARKKSRSTSKRQGFNTVLQLILWVTLIVCLLAAIFWGIQTYASATWKKQERVNIVINSNPIMVFSLHPEEKRLYVLPIPQNTYVEVSHGYGSYRLGAVYELGTLEKKDTLFAETVEEFLGIPIDGWIAFTQDQGGIPELSPEEIQDDVLRFGTFSTVIRSKGFTSLTSLHAMTNFTLFDRVRLWLEVRQLRSDQIRFGSLKDQMILSDLVLADGSIAFSADPARVEAVVQELFQDEQIRKENLSVRILNGTGKPGLSQKYARFVSNLGAHVVEIGNAERSDVEKTYIITTKPKMKDAYTTERLAKLLDSSIMEEISEKGLSDIVIIIGADYWKRLYEK
ncbi:MAG TPA: LCP family protein [Patescibacteria group bacterium]|nr:LCP family protein [Patescibacteria group bacterium]